VKEYCPDYCGWVKSDDDCPERCHHHEDQVLTPFEAMCFGRLVTVVGRNGDQYILADSSSVHESKIER